jgi:ribosomal protein L22
MTEKDYNPERKEKKAVSRQKKAAKAELSKMPGEKKQKEQAEDKKSIETKGEEEKKIPEETKRTEDKTGIKEKSEERKKPVVKKEIAKKDEVCVKGTNIPISTKHSIAICRFIKGKKIEECIKYLEKVIPGKKAIPMKGEIPHRKGRMMSGRFPKSASEEFIKLLKSLMANANLNSINEPIITEAVSNIGKRPYGRFGRTRKKRTHIVIRCREKKGKKEKEQKQEKENK